MNGLEIAFSSAADLGRRIARRELSPVDAARNQLDRIRRLDPGLRSFLLVAEEQALEEARRAEAEIAAGRILGPLHGVPIALKDLFDTAGLGTTAGSRILADRVPDADAHVVARLREAGTVLLGKLNLHEFAYGTTNENPHYGACRNPWSRDRVPGGSSGGSGAALAAGLCHLSLGTDTGGSIRIPASACAGVGLKPTFGRVSRRGVWPLSWSLDHVGPMSRTVEDAALLLEAVAGHDPLDPWSSGAAASAWSRELESVPRGLRLGTPGGPFLGDLEPDVAGAEEEALTLLERLGMARRTVEIPSAADAYTALHAILATEASALHEPWMRTRAADYGESVRRALELGYFIPAVDYVNARRFQTDLRARLLAAFGQVDVLVTPTLPRTAPAVGEAVSREPLLAWNRLVAPFNLAGLPAISVPCGFDRSGLPIGLQIVGRPFEEGTVLRVAHAYERATEWHRRRPPALD